MNSKTFKNTSTRPFPIKSTHNDAKFCVQVLNDVTDLLQLPELESEYHIKNSILGQTFQKLQISNFRQMTPKRPTDLQINFRMLLSLESPYRAFLGQNLKRTSIM